MLSVFYDWRETVVGFTINQGGDTLSGIIMASSVITFNIGPAEMLFIKSNDLPPFERHPWNVLIFYCVSNEKINGQS
jgi:hypothetical protein